MKKKSNGLVLFSVFLTCAAFALAAVALRKYGSDVTQIPSKLRMTFVTLNFTNVVAVIGCGIYAVFHAVTRKKKIICSLVLVVFATVNLLVSGVVFAGDYPYIKSIDLMYLEEVAQAVSASEESEEYDGIYYIGRQDCSPCQDFYRTLESLTEKYSVYVFFYDTFDDRETDADKMYGVLSKLTVDTVPLVFVVKNGTITNVFKGDSIEIDLRNYIANPR